MTDTDYVDDIALLKIHPPKLNSLDQTTGGIDFYVNTNKKDPSLLQVASL